MRTGKFGAVWRAVAVAFTLTLAPAPLPAQIQALALPTAEQQALYRELVRELRCLVCANQSLWDSNSALARDLRAKVEDMVRAGKTRAQITAYMVERYGEYVLYRPRFSVTTIFLWLAPLGLLLVGLGVIANLLRRSVRNLDQDEESQGDA